MKPAHRASPVFRYFQASCYAQVMPIIRDYASTDLAALYAIAVATGDRGFDASGEFHDQALLGQVYAAPYAILEPDLALVIEDQHGVAGYCVGALDTRAFETLMERRWWPALRQRYPAAPVRDSDRHSRADAGIIAMIHHPPRSPDGLVAAYPSHLHINLLPRLKGQGHGRDLLSRWKARAKVMGSTGLHLGVDPRNASAIGFYEAMGLERLFSAGTKVTVDGLWFGTRDL